MIIKKSQALDFADEEERAGDDDGRPAARLGQGEADGIPRVRLQENAAGERGGGGGSDPFDVMGPVEKDQRAPADGFEAAFPARLADGLDKLAFVQGLPRPGKDLRRRYGHGGIRPPTKA